MLWRCSRLLHIENCLFGFQLSTSKAILWKQQSVSRKKKYAAKIYVGGGDCFDRRINNWTDASEFRNILTPLWISFWFKWNEHNVASKSIKKDPKIVAPWLVKFSVGRKTGRFQFHLEKTFEWPKRWNLTASLGFLLFFASLAPSTSLVGSRIHFLVLFGRLKIRQNRFVIQNIGAEKVPFFML